MAADRELVSHGLVAPRRGTVRRGSPARSAAAAAQVLDEGAHGIGPGGSGSNAAARRGSPRVPTRSTVRRRSASNRTRAGLPALTARRPGSNPRDGLPIPYRAGYGGARTGDTTPRGARDDPPLRGDAPAARGASPSGHRPRPQDWMRALDDGPAFSRFDEKVNWLRDEHGLSHGFATAVVHEADLARAHRKLG